MDPLLLLFAGLLLLSGFFSGAETAIFSLDILKRTRLFRRQSGSSARLRTMYRQPRELLMTILIGNMLVNIALSSVAASLFGDAKLLAVVTITLVLLIFGETTPKNLAFKYNKSVALRIATPLYLFSGLVMPFRWFLNRITRPFISVPDADSPRSLLTAEELKTAVIYGHKQGVLKKDESGLISNVLRFSIKDVRHIMTPRTRIKAVPVTATMATVIKFIQAEQISKVPVYKKNKDSIVGYLNAKDLLPYQRGLKKATGISHLIRPVFYIPEGRGLAEFFPEMKRSTSRLAVVVDEYGGTAGLITLDDVLEEVMGQFLDEDEKLHEYYWKSLQGNLIFRGSTPLEVFNEALGTAVSSPDYETLSGYMMELAGDIPRKGDRLNDDSCEYVITRMSQNHISLVEVSKRG